MNTYKVSGGRKDKRSNKARLRTAAINRLPAVPARHILLLTTPDLWDVKEMRRKGKIDDNTAISYSERDAGRADQIESNLRRLGFSRIYRIDGNLLDDKTVLSGAVESHGKFDFAWFDFTGGATRKTLRWLCREITAGNFSVGCNVWLTFYTAPRGRAKYIARLMSGAFDDTFAYFWGKHCIGSKGAWLPSRGRADFAEGSFWTQFFALKAFNVRVDATNEYADNPNSPMLFSEFTLLDCAGRAGKADKAVKAILS